LHRDSELALRKGFSLASVAELLRNPDSAYATRVTRAGLPARLISRYPNPQNWGPRRGWWGQGGGRGGQRSLAEESLNEAALQRMREAAEDEKMDGTLDAERGLGQSGNSREPGGTTENSGPNQKKGGASNAALRG
jgi:hypothetical protein